MSDNPLPGVTWDEFEAALRCLPTWEQCAAACYERRASAVEQFIYNHEPEPDGFGDYQPDAFRVNLAAALIEFRKGG